MKIILILHYNDTSAFSLIVDDDSQFVFFFSSCDVMEYEIRTYQEGYKVSIAMNLRVV